jgi:bifunctional DNA-binding transcriptional regulator/antitoxin component of YhaV-PrlF toxin-antitoxin module
LKASNAAELARPDLPRRGLSLRPGNVPVASFLYVKVKAMPKISSKHQVTLPVDSLARAGLKSGDEVTIEAEGADTIVVRRARRKVDEALGVFDGLFEPGYLDRLRSQERA